jgi:hypothetical protein
MEGIPSSNQNRQTPGVTPQRQRVQTFKYVFQMDGSQEIAR